MSQLQMSQQKNQLTRGYLENGRISQISNSSKSNSNKNDGQLQNVLNHKKSLQDTQQKILETPTQNSRKSKRLEEDGQQGNSIYRSYKCFKSDDIQLNDIANNGLRFDNNLTEQSSIRYLNEQDGIKELLTLEGEYDDAMSIEYIKNNELSIQMLNQFQFNSNSNNKLNLKKATKNQIKIKSESFLFKINFFKTQQISKKKKKMKEQRSIRLLRSSKQKRNINSNFINILLVKSNKRPEHPNKFSSFKKSKEEFDERKFLPTEPEIIKKKDDIILEKIQEMQKRVNFQQAHLNSMKWAKEINRNRTQSISYGTNRKKTQLSHEQVVNNLQKSCDWSIINAQNSQTFQEMLASSSPLPATNHSKRYKKIQSTLSSYIADTSLEQQTTRPNTGNASRSYKLNLSQLGSTVRSSSLGGGGGFSSRYKDWNCLTKAIPTADFINDYSDQNKNPFDNQINLYDPTIKVNQFVQVNRLVTQSPRSSPRILETECYSKDRGYTQISKYSDNFSSNQLNKYTEEVQNMKNTLIQKLKTNCDRSFENDQQQNLMFEKVHRPKTQQNYSPSNSLNLSKQSIGFTQQRQYIQKLQQSQYDIENINSSYTVQFKNSRIYETDKNQKTKTTSSPQSKLQNNFVIKKRSNSTMRGSLNN